MYQTGVRLTKSHNMDLSTFLLFQCCGASIWYVVYRWLIFLVYLGLYIYAMLDGGVRNFVFFTYWGLLVLIFTCFLQAVVATYHVQKMKQDETCKCAPFELLIQILKLDCVKTHLTNKAKFSHEMIVSYFQIMMIS